MSNSFTNEAPALASVFSSLVPSKLSAAITEPGIVVVAAVPGANETPGILQVDPKHANRREGVYRIHGLLNNKLLRFWVRRLGSLIVVT